MRYRPRKICTECQSMSETIKTPAIAMANDTQRSQVIFSPSSTTAINAVRTGIVSVRTDAFDASDRFTPEVNPSCAKTMPKLPTRMKSRTMVRRLPRSGCECSAALRRSKNSMGRNRTVDMASGRNATMMGPSLAVAIFAPENWNAHMKFTQIRTRK